MEQSASADLMNKRGRQLTLATGFTSLLERLMLSPYSPLISEVVSNAVGPYIRTKNYYIKYLQKFEKGNPHKTAV